LSSNFSTDVIGGKWFDSARKIGYYSTLASAPRAVAELGSNLTFGLMSAPKELALGLGKYSNLSLMQNGLSFAENVGSTTVTKNWGSEILGGSKSENELVVVMLKVLFNTQLDLVKSLQMVQSFWQIIY
jgi:hypothetical protein